MEEKYILNKAHRIVPVDSNCVYVKSLKETYTIKGSGIKKVIEDIESFFLIPTSVENVLTKLSDKYDLFSIKKIIDLFLDKKVLIEYDASIANFQLNKEEYYFLNEFVVNSNIISNLSKIKLGIIGTTNMVETLIKIIAKSKLITSLAIYDIDKETKKLVDYEVENFIGISEEINIDNVIRNSDFIVVALESPNGYILEKVNRECIKNSKAWIKTVIDGLTGEIGPIHIPNKTACYQCYNERYLRNMKERNLIVLDNINKDEHEFQNAYMYSFLNINSGIVYLETIKYLSNIYSRLVSNIMYINYATWDFSIERVIKNSNCELCCK